MSGFTKLVPEILQSSIWNEPSDIRIVWITLLAAKDENGYVRGNVRSLARLANVRDKSVEVALAKFQEPDPHSNTPDNEGRRIESIPGGWFILNHAIYRAKDHKEYEAERKREYRKNKQSGTCPGQVTDLSASVSVSVSESVRGECKGEDDLPEEFKTFWQSYPKKRAKDEALKAWKKKKNRPPIAQILQAVKDQKASEQWRKNGGEFIPHPSTWINQGRWDDVVGVEEEPKDAKRISADRNAFERDLALKDCVEALCRVKDNDAEFKAQLSILNNKFPRREYGLNKDGQSLIEEALEIVAYERKRGLKQ